MRDALRSPRVWLGIVVSLIAVYFAARGVEWSELVDALSGADYVWLIPAAIITVVGQVARAARWRALFGDGPRPDMRSSFEILSIGYMVSAVLPLRLGDPVRVWLIETRTPAGGAEALATVMAERAVDFLMIAALMAVFVPRHASDLLTDELGNGPWSDPRALSAMALAMVVLVYAAMVLVSYLGSPAGRSASAALARLGVPDSVADRASRLIAGFAAGFAPLRQPNIAVLVAAWTLAIWLLGALVHWSVMLAFALGLPFAAAVFTLGATAVFAVLPSSPGYVGVFHSAVVLALGRYAGLPKETALAYAIVIHGLTIVLLIALGVWSLWSLGLSRRELGQGLQGAAAET
ncbi:MAG: lysylphosphatidylglycerol synthase transmembrane domain-containing protein [Anaerolineae bacterium]